MEEMSNSKILGLGLLGWFGIVALLGATRAILDVSGIFWQSKIGVWREDTNRKVFEQTHSYAEGQIQALQNAHHDYVMATDEDSKKMILSTVRHQFADFNADLVTDPTLAAFLLTARAN